jgi:hypothetical protein
VSIASKLPEKPRWLGQSQASVFENAFESRSRVVRIILAHSVSLARVGYHKFYVGVLVVFLYSLFIAPLVDSMPLIAI